MNGQAEIETERVVLKRIVALLFSFACLAERVSTRSYPVRCLVLWALRRSEAVMHDWLLADDADYWDCSASAAILHRNSRAEALHLCQSFRALAQLLKQEIRMEERLARRLMRGKTNRALAEMPSRRLPSKNSIDRLVETIHVATRCLSGYELAAAPPLDTS